MSCQHLWGVHRCMYEVYIDVCMYVWGVHMNDWWCPFHFQAYGWAYLDNWHNTWDQLYVYWICPFIGAILAAWMFRVVFPPKPRVVKQKKAWRGIVVVADIVLMHFLSNKGNRNRGKCSVMGSNSCFRYLNTCVLPLSFWYNIFSIPCSFAHVI